MTVFRLLVMSSVGAAMFATATSSPALAQSQVCRDLEARLVALQTGDQRQSRQAFRDYDRSVRQQQIEIDRATAEARRSRCIPGLFSIGKPAPKCDRLMATIQRMKANLRRLISQRNQFTTDPQSMARQRSEILRAMSVNRCSTTQARVRQPTSILDALFGTARTRTLGERGFFQGTSRTFRTLCVRTCDGYYFPISFSTVSSQFGRDEQTCRAMCPTAEVALYQHSNPGGNPETMVSMAGEPYSALPTAFKYRTEYDPSCSCGRAAATSLEAVFDSGGAAMPVRVVAIPPRRRDAAEDPETLANRVGAFTIRVARNPSGAMVADLPAASGIRVVGPSFYIGGETEVGALIPERKPDLREEESVN